MFDFFVESSSSHVPPPKKKTSHFRRIAVDFGEESSSLDQLNVPKSSECSQIPRGENPNDEKKTKTPLEKMGGLSCWGSLSLQLFPELMDDVTG